MPTTPAANPEARKPCSRPPTKADLGADLFLWYECPKCAARVPVWGAMPAPRHCCDSETGHRIPCVPCADDGKKQGFRECRCGATFPGSTGKRGRPREHCSEACREVAAAIVILAKHLGEIEERATPEAWLSLRAELQGRLAGRPWNKGVSRRKPAETV